jgi:cytoplasmic iron level regulating protein YaaA (DUF328/UPF0246 family)
MITVLSPAKRLQPVPQPPLAATRPRYLAEAAELAGQLRTLAPWQLESALRVNPALALDAFAAYQAFDPDTPGAPALLAYRGLAYQSMAPQDFTPEELRFAQDHLRLLSALYGALRPLDGILPHRLELVSRLRVDGKSLYGYWGDTVCRDLVREDGVLLNLASGEYARLLLPHLRPGERCITCDFLIPRRGRLVCLPTLAKMARGRMARYLIQNRIDRPEGARSFAWEGFAFAEVLSGPERYVFVQEPRE